MRAPDERIARKLSHMIIAFIFGIITGATIFLIMNGQSMEDLLLYNRVLESNMKSINQDLILSKMKEEELSYRNKQRLTIKNIEVEIIKTKSSGPDQFTETEIIDRLKDDLKFLLTMPLDSVAETTAAIEHLINGRKYEINQQEFGLELETLVIYTTIKCNCLLYTSPSPRD